jgi:pimeloyl-ACP methyl ester carboxylesterase
MTPTFASRRIAVNGLTLNVIVEGQGPDVLLVHGFPDDHAVWRHQIPALVAAGYRVIAPDTRGCGESEMAPRVRDYKLGLLVADLVGVLDALGVQQARVVAHDWGAAIAWHLCMQHPERVQRYAALSVGHPSAYAAGTLEQKLKGWYVLFFQLRGVAEWAMRAFGWFAFRRILGFASEWTQWRERLSRPGRLTAGINYYRANLDLVLPRKRAQVTVPVMGVYSTRDRFLAEEQMRESARFVSGPWRFERIDGVSHWMQLEAPERVNALLLDHLQ